MRYSLNISHAQCNAQEQIFILGNLKQYFQNHSSLIEDQFVSTRADKLLRNFQKSRESKDTYSLTDSCQPF